MRNKLLILIVITFLTTFKTYANQEIIVKESLAINSDIEMLLNHEYNNGIKVKSIKIKQVEINNNTYIKNSGVEKGDPNWISVVIEITDMKGNVTEISGGQSLQLGDFTYKVTE